MSDPELKYKGVSQFERMPEALEPGYFKTDERELPELMSYVADFSKIVTYYNSTNVKDGNWSSFFAANEVFQLASLATINSEEIKKKLNRLLAKLSAPDLPDSQKYYAMTACYEFCFSLIQKMNLLETNFRIGEISSSIKGKKSALGDFNKFALSIKQDLINSSRRLFALSPGERKFSIENFTDINFRELPVPEGLLQKEKISLLIREAQDIINCYVSTIDHAKKTLKEILDDNTYEAAPHLSIIISYLSLLLKYPIHNLNTFQERIQDYYFEKVLLEKKKPAIPDNVFLNFIPAAGNNNIFLDKGTRFPAGKDSSGREILFETNQGLNINTVEIAALHTMFLPQNEILYSPYAIPFITGMFLSDNKALTDPANGSGWAAFGEDQLGRSTRERTMKNAEVGFAISSPVFDLCEGLRTITIDVQFHPETYERIFSLLQSGNTKTSQRNIISDIQFNSVFVISATTPDSWTMLDYSVVFAETVQGGNQPGSIRFKMSLPESFPPLVNFDPRVHNGNYSPDNPVVRILLSQDSSPFAYTVLQPLGIKFIDISCTVKKLKKVSVFYEQSKLDNSKPYYPFGPAPSKGRFFLIGHRELFKKKLSALSFTLNWQNVPENGFEDYYKSYPVSFTSQLFKVGMRSLSAGRWSPDGDSLNYFLFEEDEAGMPKSTSVIQIADLDRLNIQVDPSLNEEVIYNLDSKSGFFKFELIEPDFAFGKDMYMPALTTVLQENSRKKENQPLPKQPYNPLLNDITIDYEAAEILDLTKKNQGFYHINPFTQYEVNPGQAIASQKTIPVSKEILPVKHQQRASYSYLFPSYKDQGYLFIGLKNVIPPQSLSLLFRMTSPVENVFGIGKSPAVKWSYLSNDSWKLFPDDNLPLDGTDELVRTGIITFSIPHDIKSDNVIMPSGLFWLRASVANNKPGEKYVVSDIVEIVCNSALCTRVLSGNDFENIEPVLPFAIKDLEVPDPSIKKVIQSQASFGGTELESTKKYYTRVSERLRHKGRAVTTWDFERLILERFPEIFKIICIRGAGSEMPSAGGIRLIVVPDVEKNSLLTNRLAPRASLSLLEEVRNFVAGIASPFVSVFVSNPNYETVKVNCSVKFRDNSGAEFYANQLNSDLQFFLSPWIRNGLNQMKFNTEINMYTVLNFIENRPYVSSVTGFSIIKISSLNEEYRLCDSVSKDNPAFNLPVKASSNWSILVSAEKHNITILESKTPIAPQAIGLDQMIISDDFIINNTDLCL